MSEKLGFNVAVAGAAYIDAPGEAAEREAIQAEIPTAAPEAGNVPDTIPAEERRTDLGNARRFVRGHRGSVRFCFAWGRGGAWLHFDGKRWVTDESGEIERRAKQTVESIYAKAAEIADEKERIAMAGHAVKSESAGRIAAMIELAQSEPGIPVAVEEMDRDPWLLNVENGTIDLRSGVRREHRAGDLITKLAPVPYSPEATCPNWEAFLGRIFNDNRSLIEFFHRAAGYSLTGRTSEQVMFVLHGNGANGKTTAKTAIENTMGDYAQATPPETLMASYHGDGGGEPSEDVARLRGARAVFADESEDGRRLAEGTVKQLTGGDKVVARHLYGHFFEFRPTFKLWYTTNHLPNIRGQDEAIWRRILKIPFNVTIPKAERVPDFFEKILRPELPGILTWGVAGALLWQKHGLESPDEVRQATADYRQDMDVIAAFIEGRCLKGPSEKEAAGRLFKAYLEWCEKEGETATNKNTFGRRLTEKGFTLQKATGGLRERVGLSLKPGDQS